MKISNKAYNVLKFICTILLPALSVLYSTLAQTWSLPYENEVTITLNAIALFIGAIIGVSSKNYWSDVDIAESNLEPEAVETDDE